MESFRDLLKAHNLSLTPVRLAVLRALHCHPHADAERVFHAVSKEITATSKQAIYNNLHALLERGLIREIKPKGQPSLYELRVGDNHHHIVCRSCGAVADADCADGHAPCLAPHESHGFVIDEAEVTFWGVCPACQNNHKEKEEKS